MGYYNDESTLLSLDQTAWIASGILLGYTRENDIIPWDGDVDMDRLIEPNDKIEKKFHENYIKQMESIQLIECKGDVDLMICSEKVRIGFVIWSWKGERRNAKEILKHNEYLVDLDDGNMFQKYITKNFKIRKYLTSDILPIEWKKNNETFSLAFVKKMYSRYFKFIRNLNKSMNELNEKQLLTLRQYIGTLPLPFINKPTNYLDKHYPSGWRKPKPFKWKCYIPT
ncbi:hypothetical protein SNEBB_006877 [Seison nebaliae]|nr:hypothetical protein SNEBB_006877 [Seison nebaliae]